MATPASNVSFEYALGYTSAEHERLIRQAAVIAPRTEQLFRQAGIGPGQRVMDLGSGVGDVSILLAKLVGTMQAPVVKFVQTLNEVPGKFVRTMVAIHDQKATQAA